MCGSTTEQGDRLERADDGHYACDLDGCHFAVFPADGEGKSPGLRQSGTSFSGFTVESVEETVEAARAFGARAIQEPSVYPWGLRAVLEDPTLGPWRYTDLPADRAPLCRSRGGRAECALLRQNE